VSIERLSPAEQVMLWPDQIWPQDIGALIILDGFNLSDPDGRFRIEAVRELVASRLHLVPRFRHLLYTPPRRLGGPLWVDDSAFDLSNHVVAMSLPAPANEAQLLLAAERLIRRRLERSRPLWGMWFFTGLADGRVGLFVKMHHSIGDAIAAVATFATFFDFTPNAIVGPAEPWTPAPPPSANDLLADHRLRRLSKRRSRLSVFAHPVMTVRKATAAWPAMRELLAEKPLAATSLSRLVGPDRHLAVIRGGVDDVKAVAHAYGAKMNDVFLSVIAGGLRALLSSRGEPIDQVVMRIYVPVSLRHRQYAEARGNVIGQMVIPLPIGVSDPVQRLQQIAAETAMRKARSRPSVGGMPTRGLAGKMFLKLIDRQRVNVESADIPGPEQPLYFAGARLLELFPVLPLIGKVSLGVAGMSYAGQFNITAVGDRDIYPDIDIFAAAVRDELRALRVTLPRPAVA
jgi:diacylglycerol O-acyltransferase / wax synthase